MENRKDRQPMQVSVEAPEAILYRFINTKTHQVHFESGYTLEEAFLKMLSYTDDQNVFNWSCFSTTEHRILHLDYTQLIMYSLSMAKAMREAWA